MSCSILDVQGYASDYKSNKILKNFLYKWRSFFTQLLDSYQLQQPAFVWIATVIKYGFSPQRTRTLHCHNSLHCSFIPSSQHYPPTGYTGYPPFPPANPYVNFAVSNWDDGLEIITIHHSFILSFQDENVGHLSAVLFHHLLIPFRLSLLVSRLLPDLSCISIFF